MINRRLSKISLTLLCSVLILFSANVVAGLRTWDGGGDGQSWTNPTNWVGDVLPVSGDDVVIDVVGTNATVIYSGGSLTLASLRSEESLNIAAGSITLTNGASWSNGGLVMASDRTLTVRNAGASFTASGVVAINGAYLAARDGATLSLPTLGSYVDSSGCCGSLLESVGSGSVLDLRGMTNLTGNPTWTMTIRALSGGSINASNVVQVENSNLYLLSDGSGSAIHLQGLTAYSQSRIITLEARNNGMIHSPNLVNAPRVAVVLNSTGDLPTAQLKQLFDLTVNGQNRTLPALTNINGGSVRALGGASVVLPAVAGYVDTSGCCGSVWEASGSGSAIDVPALTSLAGNPTWSMTLRSLAGGTLRMGSVTQIPDSNLGFLADGTGSQIVLSNLTTLAATGRTVSFEARNAGTIDAPQLTNAPSGVFTLRSGGDLDLAQLSRARGFTVQNTVVTLPALTNLNGANLSVSSGGGINFPALGTFADTAGCCGVTWEANGVGTYLNFPALTNLAGNPTWSPTIRALAGGTIHLGAVTHIPDSLLRFLADGTNSVIILTNLPTYAGPNRLIAFEARNTGVVQTPLLMDGYYSTFTVRSGGSLNLNQLTRSRGFTVEGASLTLPLLTNLSGANISIAAGGSATFPALQSFEDNAGCCGILWEATGAGSMLSFPNLTRLTGNPAWTPTIRALAGGRVDLGAVIQIPDSYINFLADGTNSWIVLTNLTSVTSAGRRTTFDARNSGVIDLTPGLFSATRATFTSRNAGANRLGSLALYTGAILAGTGPVNADVFNYSGSLEAGTSPGFLTLNSNYLQTGGTLLAEIGGSIVGSNYDRVVINGAATLGGTLQISRINNFTPALTNIFSILVASNISGTFSNYTGLDAGSSLEFVPAVSSNAVTVSMAFSFGPRVIAVSPTNAVSNSLSSFTVTFNEPVASSSFVPADATLTGPNGAIPIIGIDTLSLTNYRVRFAPQFAQGTYTLVVGPGINDIAGNPMNQDQDLINGEAIEDAFQTTVTLNDATPPTITSIIPSTAVKTSVSTLTVLFNEPLLPGTFTTNDIVLSGPSGPIPIISLNESNPTNWVATFAVQSAAGTYTFSIGPNIQDLPGNSMVEAVTGGFAIDYSGPLVLGMSPSGSITQAVSHVDLTFNEPLNLSTFTTGDVLLTGPNGTVPLNTVTSIGGAVYRIAFAQQAVNGTYTIRVGPQITDVAGNLMNQDGDAIFGEATQDQFNGAFTVSTPDLAVLAVTGPASALPGETITVSWIVTNGGNASVTRAITELVSLSTDAVISNDFRVATFELTNSLPPGAWIARTQSVTLPLNGPAGALRLVVQTDCNNQIPEGNEINNFAIADSDLVMPLALNLRLSASTVREGNVLPATLTRNGGTDSSLSVTLASTDAGELTAPSSVTILAGQSEVPVNLTAVLDGIADGPQLVSIQASAAGFIGASNQVTVLDADIPALSLVLSNSIVVEGKSVIGTVVRQGLLSAPLLVTLGSSSPGQASLPASVTIPAGQASAPFAILAVDDPYIESFRGYSITATAAGFETATGTVNIIDNDQPTLLLSLEPTQIREGAGANAATLIVTRTLDSSLPVEVQLSSSRPADLKLQSTVTFFPSELVKQILLSPVDDSIIESNSVVTLTAQLLETLARNPIPPGVSTNLMILDDDGPSLILAISRDWVCSGNGTNSPLASATVTITRTGSLVDAVPVSLVADLPSLLSFPSLVTLAAGSATTNFTISVGTGNPPPSGQTVLLNANAAGFSTGVAMLQRVSDCRPDLVIETLTVPTNGLTDEYFSVNYREINRGTPFAIGNQPPAISNISQRVYLSTDPNVGNDTFIGAVIFNGSVDPYVFLDRKATLRLPNVVGDYWVIVQADGSNDVFEVSEANNFRVSSSPIHVAAAYSATVSASFESAPAGTPAILSGVARKSGTTSPAPFELVNLHIGLRGTTRVISALTDANGNFSATFTPLPGEAGTYTVGASHPGVTGGVPTQDTFTLVGMRVNPATLSLVIPALTSATQELALANLGDVPLSALTVSALGLPAEFSVTATVTPTLLPFGSGILSIVIGVNTDTNLTRTFTLRTTSAEGAVADVSVTVTSESLRPRLVALPSSLAAGVVPGQQRFLEFTVVNQGGAPSGTLTVQPPVFPFLRVLTPPTLPPLAPGQSNIITLQLAPAPTQPLGLFAGDLVIGDGTATVNVPCNFRIVSTNTSTLLVEVTDQFTYYAEGAPRVAGARVELKDPYTGIVLTNKLSDASGLALFTDVIEGYYTVRVTADEHEPFQTTLFTTAADTTYQEALMNRETVQFFWTVAPTEIADRTKITIEAVFETVVPVPVLTVSPSVIDLADFPNGGSINLTITNHGLLAAQDVRMAFSSFECWRITPLISDIGTLAARSSITIPVEICHDVTCTGDFQSCAAAGGLALNRTSPAEQENIRRILGRVQNLGRGAGGGGCGGGGVTYLVPCGDGSVGGSAPVGVANAGGSGCGGSPGGGGGQGSGGLGGGGGGGGGTSNCDPCALELAVTLAGCALDYLLPLPDILSCAKDSYECYTEPGVLDCAAAIVSCLVAAGKNVPILGDILDALSCADDLLSACGGGGLAGAAGFRPEASRGAIRLPSYAYPGMAQVALSGRHVQAVLGVYSNLFGGQAWLEAASEINFGTWLTVLESSQAAGGESGIRISTTERSALINHPVTNDITIAEIEKFVDRWNRTLDYFAAGIYYSTAVPEGMSTDFIAFDIQRRHIDLAREAMDEAEEQGFASVFEELKSSVDQLRAFVLQPGGGICAQVRLRIDQEAVIARDAFRASLVIANDSSTSLSNVTVNLIVVDSSGRVSNPLFAIAPPTISGIGAVDGTGVVVPGAPASVAWTIIPTTESALDQPQVYFVSGSIRYTQNGIATTVPLAAQTITVHPIAQLQVTYFHQRDVLGDDPFTDEVEPSVPYSLATIIRNTGFGTARNVRITSAQPQIIENEKGLFIDFQIIATEVAGQNVMPSLTANFGDLVPGGIGIGRWLLKSTLQGLFVEYSATFEHLDNLGDPRASIIQSVDIRELIRIVSAPGLFQDNLPDMLVNDFEDLEDLPDKLYLSDGTVHPVGIVTSGVVGGSLAPSNLQVTLAANTPVGWTYLRVPDPGKGLYRLKQVLRSDNVAISVETNAWTTDRTFIGGGKRPILENNLHILDYNSTGSYTLIYEPLPVPDTEAPSSSITPLPANSFLQIPLTWTGTDAGSGIATFDIYVSDNGSSFAPWLERTPLFGAVYTGLLGHTYAFYSVAVDQSGNRETAPSLADATTSVNRTNSAPVLTLGPDVNAPEGTLITINNSATDNEIDVQTLSYRLASGAPPNVSINPTTGRITWATGEGNGPSTNLIGVIVSDNGFPPLSATGFVSVVVSEVNVAPVVTSAGPFTINEGVAFTHTFQATDADLPINAITWSLGIGAPSGASIGTHSGQFLWTPTTLQGPSTNVIEIVATDNGQPPLPGNRFVTIIVRNSQGDFILAIGRTNVFSGESNSVPISLVAGFDLASLSFTLATDAARLANLSLQNISPQVATASLVPNGASQVSVSFDALPGGTLSAGNLALLGFNSLSNASSAFVRLQPASLLGRRTAGGALTNGLAQGGRIVVIGAEPLVEALLQPVRQLVLWGLPGVAYDIEYATPLGAAWLPWQSTTASEPMTLVPAHQNLSPVFYRAIRLGP